MCAIFELDKEASQEFHGCLCVSCLALRVICRVYNLSAFSLSKSVVLFGLLMGWGFFLP